MESIAEVVTAVMNAAPQLNSSQFLWTFILMTTAGMIAIAPVVIVTAHRQMNQQRQDALALSSELSAQTATLERLQAENQTLLNQTRELAFTIGRHIGSQDQNLPGHLAVSSE